MAKIFYILGKSSTGKDTIYKQLIGKKQLELNSIVMYTTRPMREGECNGVEYFFTDEVTTSQYEKDGSIVEMRKYNTIYGLWKYYTRNDGQVELESNKKYLVSGTLEGYRNYCSYYGKEQIVPIYIHVDDGIRLERALEREKKQVEPRYAEMCRRFLADDADFSEEKLKECEIHKKFVNDNLENCISEIMEYIQKYK